jgi:hypothetical protein
MKVVEAGDVGWWKYVAISDRIGALRVALPTWFATNIAKAPS